MVSGSTKTPGKNVAEATLSTQPRAYLSEHPGVEGMLGVISVDRGKELVYACGRA